MCVSGYVCVSVCVRVRLCVLVSFCVLLRMCVCVPLCVLEGVSVSAQAAIISADTKGQHTQARHSHEIKLLEARQALQRRRQSLDPLRPKLVDTAVHGTRGQSVSHTTHNACV